MWENNQLLEVVTSLQYSCIQYNNIMKKNNNNNIKISRGEMKQMKVEDPTESEGGESFPSHFFLFSSPAKCHMHDPRQGDIMTNHPLHYIFTLVITRNIIHAVRCRLPHFAFFRRVMRVQTREPNPWLIWLRHGRLGLAALLFFFVIFFPQCRQGCSRSTACVIIKGDGLPP